MKKKLGLHLALNGLSFGQLSTLILRVLYEREKNDKSVLDLYLFPIGNIDLASQREDRPFVAWIQEKINKATESWDRSIPVLKLWHLSQSLESYSNNQTLLSFYELDSPTKVEINIARNNKLCFTSAYTCEVFKNFGVESKYIPPVFDSYNFQRLEKKFHADGRIVFNLCGKLENKRKRHAQIIQSWIKKYGGNSKYVLQCALYNPFLQQQTPQGIQDMNNHFLGQIVGNNKPFNVVFYPPMAANAQYNEFLNSANIVIGLSGGEGIDLPVLQSMAMGKHAICLNAHGYKGYANAQNSVLVNASGKEDAVDNIFFHKGAAFNQGNVFTWNDEDFIKATEEAIKRVEANPINTEGLKIKDQFSPERFVDELVNHALK